MREKVFSVTLNDCDVQTFTVGGHGGAGKDTSNTGVRIVHRASGATGEGRESRSQLENKRTAFKRMALTPTFQTWARLRAQKLVGRKSVEQLVEEAMEPQNLRIEVRNSKGQWETEV
jgi:protein subunit release factor A